MSAKGAPQINVREVAVVLQIAGPWTDAADIAARCSAQPIRVHGQTLSSEDGTVIASVEVVRNDATMVETMVSAGEGRLDAARLAEAPSVVRIAMRTSSVPSARLIFLIGSVFAGNGAQAILVSPPDKAHSGNDWRLLFADVKRGVLEALYFAFRAEVSHGQGLRHMRNAHLRFA